MSINNVFVERKMIEIVRRNCENSDASDGYEGEKESGEE